MDEPSRRLVTVVLSFRNEREVLPELIQRLERALASCGVEYELLFVDDDSDDGSLEILREHAARNPRIKVITMSRRFGVYECVFAGLDRSSGDAVICMDADLQDPPEVVPQLVQKWLEGADVVYTVRRSRAGESRFKMLLTALAYRVLHAASRISLPVDAGDFRLLSRRVVDELVKLEERDPYFRGLISWVGFRQVPVLYDRAARFAGETRRGLMSLEPLRVFLAGLTTFSVLPLTIFLVVGLAVGGIGLLVTTGGLLAWLSGAPVGGWAAVLAALLVLSGVQLIGIGSVGLYLGRVLDEVRGRPRYVVESTINLAPR